MTSADLLEKIHNHIALTGIGRSYFGLLCVRDGKLIDRLEAGGEVTLRTATQILAFMKDREEALNADGKATLHKE